MIDKRELELILLEQKQDLEYKAKMRLCHRAEEAQVDLESSLAQVVIGVRRSGKSTLCLNVLKSAGVTFGYANFDDERLNALETEDLNNVLEVLYKINGEFNHLFLDEVQNVDGWHLFVNRLLRRGMKVLITGSNAKLLSGELSTHLTGRHSTIELYPFSFKEFCDYKQVDTQTLTTVAEAARRSAFDEYLRKGGFPELLTEKNSRKYVSSLTDDILERDIRQRHKVKYFAAFERMAHHLMNVAPAVLSVADLSKTFGIKSAQTADNYVKYLKQAYLLVGLNKYSPKSRQRLTEEKVYTVDVAVMDQRPDAMAGDNLGWRLETVVFLELLRRASNEGQDIYYYKKDSRAKEVDFALCKGNKVLQLYQVCLDLTAEKTRNRELSALFQASEETGCRDLFLITDTQRSTVEKEGRQIRILPAYEWLLGEGAE